MFRPSAAAACAVLATACATSSLPAGEMRAVPSERIQWIATPVTPSDGTLMVARDTGFSGSGAVVTVTVNGKAAATIEGGEALRMRVPAGRYVVAAQARAALGGEIARPRSVEVSVAASGTALVRIGFDEMARGFSVWVDAVP